MAVESDTEVRCRNLEAVVIRFKTATGSGLDQKSSQLFWAWRRAELRSKKLFCSTDTAIRECSDTDPIDGVGLLYQLT